MFDNHRLFRAAWCISHILLLSGLGFAETVVTEISRIRALPREVLEQGAKVETEAQVAWVHPRRDGAFLLDGKSGVYASFQKKRPPVDAVRLGDIIRVAGTITPGDINPAILIDSFEVIGAEELPPTRPFDVDEMFLPTVDCEWVTVTGRLISMEVVDWYSTIMLTIEVHGHEVDIQLRDSPGAVERLAEIMYHMVEVNAIAGLLYNSLGQVTGRKFYVNSVEDFSLTIKDPKQEPKSFKILEMQSSAADLDQLIRVSGRVTYAEDDDVYLRGDDACLKVKLQDHGDVRVGDHVQLDGYVWPQPVSPAFRACTSKILERKEAPEPVPFDVDEHLATRLNGELVQLDVQLVDIGRTFDEASEEPSSADRTSLLCRAGNYLFRAELPRGFDLGDIEPGAELRLTGICNLTLNPKIRFRLEPNGFWLQLRSGDGVELLRSAPWWTATRLRWLMAMLLGVLFISILWTMFLRKTVENQTQIISKKIERETINEERQRMARELHDNLEQGLAGMAVQLRACLKQIEVATEERLAWVNQATQHVGDHDIRLKNLLTQHSESVATDEAKSRRSIEVVQNMLSFCSLESRNAILDLRGGLLEQLDLPAAVRETLEPMLQESDTQLTIEIKGQPRRLRRRAERNLLLIAKEAVNNAACHASALNIGVTLTYSAESISMTITDDGCGFLVDQLALSGRFGLQGMRERIKKLNGEIEISSEPGIGTKVEVSLNTVDQWELEKP